MHPSAQRCVRLPTDSWSCCCTRARAYGEPMSAPMPPTKLDRLELERIVPPREASRLRGESWDSMRRNEPQHVVRLSLRRVGMRVKHALKLAD